MKEEHSVYWSDVFWPFLLYMCAIEVEEEASSTAVWERVVPHTAREHPYIGKHILADVILCRVLMRQKNGWYPEVVLLTVVFFNSSFTALLFQNTTVFELVTPYLSFSFKIRLNYAFFQKK